jgi:hypothetical protein
VIAAPHRAPLSRSARIELNESNSNMRYLVILLAIICASSAAARAQSSDHAGDAIPPASVASSLRSVVIHAASANAREHTVDIDFALRVDAEVGIELIDNAGHSIAAARAGSYRRGEGHASVAIGELPSGTYLLRLSTPMGLAQERVVIER